ncbi:MAG: response regulator [Singulisphaera sp.]
MKLPVATQQTVDEPKPTRKPADAKPGLRILVVDDNHDTAVGLSKLLGKEGHRVQTAYDGPSALEVARSERPQVILADIGLPGMDGYELAREIRKEESTKEALLVAISGYGQDEDLRRSREAGFDHHLVKPVDFDSLIALIGRRN